MSLITVLLICFCLTSCSTERDNSTSNRLNESPEGQLSLTTTRPVNEEQNQGRFEESRSIANYPNEVPLSCSRVSLDTRTTRNDGDFYSVRIKVNSQCLNEDLFNGTFLFRSSSPIEDSKSCSLVGRSDGSISCGHLIPGLNYTITCHLKCKERESSSTTWATVLKPSEPIYLNSSRTSTSIELFFKVPGVFVELMVELSPTNQRKSVLYSSSSRSIYRVKFENLPVAEVFQAKLNLRPAGENSSLISVHTGLDELDLRCSFNEEKQRVEFSWKKVESNNYENISVSIFNRRDELVRVLSCLPRSSGCSKSVDEIPLEEGEFYSVRANLSKIFGSIREEVIDRCSFQTNLKELPIESLRHEFLDERKLLLSWSKQRSEVRARLVDVEKNEIVEPVDCSNSSALFDGLTEASLFRVELNISRERSVWRLQSTNYSIKTGFNSISIENVFRPTVDSFLVRLDREPLFPVQKLFCVESLFVEPTFRFCSSSNRLENLFLPSIYNLSVTVFRQSLSRQISWTNRTKSTLVKTSLPKVRIRPSRSNETDESFCSVERSIQERRFVVSTCFSVEPNGENSSNCGNLVCGCRFVQSSQFNASLLESLCSNGSCPFLFDENNPIRVLFETPLEPVRRFRLKNIEPIERRIEVSYDRPSGCFDQLVLICESVDSRVRRVSFGGFFCENLVVDQLYRIYVQTRRHGWENVNSNRILARFDSVKSVDSSSGLEETIFLVEKKLRSISENKIVSILVPISVSVVLVLLFLSCLSLGFFCRKKTSEGRSEDRISALDSSSSEKIDSNDENRRSSLSAEENKSNRRKNQLNSFIDQFNKCSLGREKIPVQNENDRLDSKKIALKDLPEAFRQLEQDNSSLVDEFQRLGEVCRLKSNYPKICHQSKDRYQDIKPYQHSAVKLDSPTESYINASFIKGINDTNEYIACQAPLQTTINDHWLMIWQENVSLIVMLTGLVEQGFNKSCRYWPTDFDEKQSYGEIVVSVETLIRLPSYDLRHLTVGKDGRTRSIRHFSYKHWSDHTAPKNSSTLVKFIRSIRSKYEFDRDGPLLVHCSAGVGRSGTFIALDRLLQEFDRSSADERIDIFGTVFQLRRSRELMVQNKDQYLFIYQCLKEEFEKKFGCRDSSIE